MSFEEPRLIQRVRRDLPEHIRFQLDRAGFGELILARAAQLASEELLPLDETHIIRAIDEFRSIERNNSSWAGFLYALGGSLVGIGGCSLLAAHYLVTPPWDSGSLMPFGFLTVSGFLIIIAGKLKE
jgi:hypothetical protein